MSAEPEAARVELWASRARSVRNVCGLLALGCFALVPFSSMERTPLAAGAIAAAGIAWAGAWRAARRRPYGVGVFLTSSSAVGYAALLAAAIALELPGEALSILALTIYWPLSYLVFSIELGAASRPPRPGGPAGPLAVPLAVPILRAIATPLGWLLLAILSAWIAFLGFSIAAEAVSR